MTLEQLIESIASRKALSPYGISTAAAYIHSMEPCLSGDGLCPVKLFGLASADDWKKELDGAGQRLTYCDKSMADPDFLAKSVRDDATITKGAVLEYDCILSSKSKDRDGDIVHQKGGLDVDLKMPLLWQHIQVSPIGKHVALLDQDDEITKSRFAIADTELGRDAATLVKFGALRKSIGFKPHEFAPLQIVKGADGKDIVKGWEIKRSACMEGSLVSIPANAKADILAVYEKEFDGLCTAHGRGLLKHAMVKHWAKGLSDLRPVQVPGIDLHTKDGGETSGETSATIEIGGAKIRLKSGGKATGRKDCGKCKKCGKNMGASGRCATCGANGGMANDKSLLPPDAKAGQAASTATDNGICPRCNVGRLDSAQECPNCGHIVADSIAGSTPKNATSAVTKSASLSTKLYGNEYIDGSFEKVQATLRRTASDYLRGKGIDTAGSYNYAELLATFAESAIVCLYSYGAAKSPCYRISYATDKEGVATWTGDATEVEVKQTVVEKRVAEIRATTSPLALARHLASKMLTADGASAEIEKAHETISKAYATLKQSRETFELEELFAGN